MDLLPGNRPKRSFKRLPRTLLIGAVAGAVYGALAGYFTDDPSLVIFMLVGGAFAGFLVWCKPPNVIWGRFNGDQARSNSTPHSDARASAVLDQPPSARAGERGR